MCTARRTIPLLLEFDEPETTIELLIADNDLLEVVLKLRPHEEPEQEMLAATPSADPPVFNAIGVRLGSGADDNPSTTTAAKAEDDSVAENIDRCGRDGSRRNRSRRTRSRCGRSYNARSGSDDSEMSVVVEIADEQAVGISRGGRKTSRGGCGRKADKTAAGGQRVVTKKARGVGADKKQAPHGARKSSKGGPRGRKTASGEQKRRTM